MPIASTPLARRADRCLPPYPRLHSRLILYAAAGLACLLASWPGLPTLGGYGILILGRLLLGLGESVAMVGMFSWAIGLIWQTRSCRITSLVGAGMYGSIAAGVPSGLWLLERSGFVGVMGARTTLPLPGLLAVHRLPGVAPHAGRREPLWRIVGRIGRLGAVVGLQGVGSAPLGAFLTFLFLSRGWPHTARQSTRSWSTAQPRLAALD